MTISDESQDGHGYDRPGNNVRGVCDNRGMSASVSVLDREMYSEAEAARLLRVPQGTLHYWLEGKSYRGREHPPVIRTEPTGKKTVTWAEFVESALLSQYRRRRVPLDHVRQFILILREKTGVPYPLAHERPWAIAQHLVVLDAQRAAELPDEYMLYAPVGDQPMLLPPARDFLDRVKFEDDEAVLWRPAGKDSRVVIDPERRSGRPSIQGISTAVLNEYADDGYSYQEIAEEFNLKVREVEMAVAYELTSKTAA